MFFFKIKIQLKVQSVEGTIQYKRKARARARAREREHGFKVHDCSVCLVMS